MASVHGAALDVPLDVLTEPEQAILHHIDEANRPKRSGDVFSAIKNSIGQGVKGTIGFLTQGSISAASKLSSSSSSKGYSYDAPHPEVSSFPQHVETFEGSKQS